MFISYKSKVFHAALLDVAWGCVYMCRMQRWKLVAFPTSEALVAWCDGERTLLHGQLVELGELGRNSSRGRLWEGGGAKQRDEASDPRRKKQDEESSQREHTQTHTWPKGTWCGKRCPPLQHASRTVVGPVMLVLFFKYPLFWYVSIGWSADLGKKPGVGHG